MTDRDEKLECRERTKEEKMASRDGQGLKRGVSRAKKIRKKGAEERIKTEASPDVQPGKSHKKPAGKKAGLAAACAAAVILMAGGGVYAAMAQRYKAAFFPNTQINGLDASGKTMEEVKNMIASGINGYTLTIEMRDGQTEQITGEEIGLHAEFDGSLEKVLETQNPYAWLDYQLNPASYSIDTMVLYDEAALESRLESLFFLDPAQMKEPVNAAVSEYVPGQGYHVIPEEAGTVVDEAVFREKLGEALKTLTESLSLEEIGAYKEAEIKQDNPKLLELVNTMNRYAGVTVTYQFGSQTEVLNGDRIHDWLTFDEAGNVAVDAEQAAAYVAELAASYNTSNKAKTFKTSYGPTITVKGGTYGWKINQSEETAELLALIAAGESQTREPVYSQKGASRDGNDYGTTYVEINLTGQHLYMYKEGKLVVESDFVSGNLSRGWGTPAGTYPLTYKQRNAVLKGENYRTPVDYWMPFNGGIGMHDATWRTSFGGTIYKTSGSHGCINLPHNVAKIIYENIQAGMPVICYNLEGTEKKGSTTAAPPAKEPETQVPAETQVPVTEPSVTPNQPSETNPDQTNPSHTGPGGDAGVQQPSPNPPAQAPTEAPAANPDGSQPGAPGTGTAEPAANPTGPAGPGSDTADNSAAGPGA